MDTPSESSCALQPPEKVIYLWSARRRKDIRIFDPDVPSNMYFGAREIGARSEVVNLTPANPDDHRLLRFLKALPSAFRYFGPALRYAAMSRAGTASVTYTLKWAAIHTVLKAAGIARNRLIFMNLANDVDLERLGSSPLKKFVWGKIYDAVDAVQFVTMREVSVTSRIFPKHADKFFFFPTPIDVTYYRSIPDGSRDIPHSRVVAVGNDEKRDWEMVVELARRGIEITVLTTSGRARSTIENAPAGARRNIRLEFGRTLRESAQFIKRADCILLSTLSNERFSGSTTVGVAASLRVPLVLDEAHELGSYGLASGANCEHFERGNADSAERVIRRILDDPGHAAALAEAIGKVAETLSMDRQAEILIERLQPARAAKGQGER